MPEIQGIGARTVGAAIEATEILPPPKLPAEFTRHVNARDFGGRHARR